MDEAEKAARRAKALKRLEETKRRLKENARPASAATLSSAPSSVPAAIDGNRGQANTSAPQSTMRDATQATKSGLFSKPYIEYDMSTLLDSRGGFMVEESADGKPVDRQAQWLDTLAAEQPPYDFDDPRAPRCFECNTPELDFRLWRVFKTRVCSPCRRLKPEKYSLLTKTECRLDYLLTDPELRDEELMPHMERPNPHQSTYSNMMLYMRYQVEEFAFKKWGSPEALDAEYERREAQKKVRKQAKFEKKLKDMRHRTRAQAITSAYSAAGKLRHVHRWSEAQTQSDGQIIAKCEDCGKKRSEISLSSNT